MRLFNDFSTRTDGNIAITAALMISLLCGLVFGVIDYSAAVSARTALQARVDAAALGAARSTAVTDAEMQSVGNRYMAANSVVTGPGQTESVQFKSLNGGERISVTAVGYVKTTILGFFNKDRLSFEVESEVMRATKNIEVSLVLDTTGSMAGSRLTDLKAAAKELIGIVVKDTQSPFYSKVAIVPYSLAVNAGTYADQLRGTATAGTCNTPGCKKYKFNNPNNDSMTHSISDCVTERVGSQQYTDAPPTVALLGRNYASPNNPCSLSPITPLNSNKTTLKDSVDALKAGGSTGGHIGVAWGWYMVSEKFGTFWPTASRPGVRDTKLTKAVVLMTDGEYNSTYCNGVISKDSTSGSGSTTDHINCNATNGNSYTQAMTLCKNMKDAGIIVYTVGLEVVNTQAARDLVNKCATSPAHVYLPATSSALTRVFAAIAQDISALRISQ